MYGQSARQEETGLRTGTTGLEVGSCFSSSFNQPFPLAIEEFKALLRQANDFHFTVLLPFVIARNILVSDLLDHLDNIAAFPYLIEQS